MKNKSISFFIAFKTVPWLIVILSISCVVLLFLAKKVINEQLQSRHQQVISQFNDNFEKALDNIEHQIVNVSNNELIINSLIDPQEREQYIPLFIRSFALAGIDNAYLSLVDFSGKTISENDSLAFADLFNDLDWQTPVLNLGENYRHLDNRGLLIAVPVSFADLPEGAVLAKIPFVELHQLLHLGDGNNSLVYLDFNNKIIYSSDAENFIIDSIYEAKNYKKWFSVSSSVKDGYRIVSSEPKDVAYKKFYLFMIFMAAAIALAIMCTAVSIVLSSRLISKTLNKFINSLKSEESVNLIDADDPDELININTQFQSLAQNLSEAQLLKNNIQSILNSLNEYLVVFNFEGETRAKNDAFDWLSSKIDLGESTCFKKIIPVGSRNSALSPSSSVNDFEEKYKLIITDSEALNSECVIRWSRSLYYSEDGNLDGVIFIGVDVTKAREIEKELYIKNRAVEEAGNGIVIANALEEGMPLAYVNQAFLKMSGYDAEDILGKNCAFLQGEKTDQSALQRISEALEKKEQISETLLNYRKDGTEFFNQLILTPIRNQNNQVTHYLGVHLDVTDRVKADQYLLEAKVKAEESAKLKSEFLASMSHEIRTPMNGVLGMLGLLNNTQLNQQQSHYTTLASSSAESLLLLIDDILDFSKVEAGKMELEIIDFDLPAMLGELSESMAQKAQEKGLEFILDLTEINTAFVRGDPGRLRQILTNLTANAIKFTEQGNIVIRAGLKEKGVKELQLECSVIDSGIGIPSNKIDQLFNSFSQVDASTTRKYGGTGLGLAIVKNLCELMQGEVNVSSRLGSGSEFTFTITLGVSEQSAEMSPRLSIENSRVLIVDDNSVNRKVLNSQLSQWGMNITEAANGRDALEKLEASLEDPFGIVFIDMIMPDMDGKQLGQTIRSDQRFDDLQLVMMTPLNQRGGMQLFSHLGFNAFFPKPATINDLISVFDVLQSEVQHISTDIPLTPQSHPDSHDLTKIKRSNKKSHARLLLVEDNLINQEVALGVLKMLGYDADVANNGCEALERLDEASYELVLMDCQMPKMDGYETTRIIRQGNASSAPNIPIIAMTANAMKGDKEKCLAAGMNDYLSKPIDPEKLHNAIKTWLSSDNYFEDESETQGMSTDEERNIWDRDSFMGRIMNNETIADKLIDLFKTDTPKTIAELENAVNSEKVEEAGLLAHKLKGSVSNLGGIELADLAKEIERAGQQSNLDEMKALWPQVWPQYDKLLNIIESQR